MKRAFLMAFAVLLAGVADAKTLIVNANGYTPVADGALARFAMLLVGDDGKVLATLPKGATEPKLAAGDFRLDAKGATLWPGLIDAHGHVMGLGFQLRQLDLSQTRSLEEAQATIRAYAAANPTAAWIRGRGWNQVQWGLGRFPTASDLDAAVADRPVLLERVDGHAMWANTAAIRAAGVTAKSQSPKGGRIERLPNGVPAGVFVDAAGELVAAKAPAPTAGEAEAALSAALKAMAQVGLTGVHDMGVDGATWNLYRSFGDRGMLTARITGYAAGLQAVEAISPLRPTPWLYEERLRLQGIKFYADGALGSRGAWLKAPYSDDPANRGLQFVETTRLKNMLSRGNFLGYQNATHAIGDAANGQVLDAYEELAPAYGGKFRNRVEHAQVVDPADLPRFAKLGIIASMQPTHATSDKAMAGDRIGEARLGGAYAWKTLTDSGARMAFGSDFPVEPVNPFFGLHAAVTRQDREGQPPGGWRAEEALPLATALRDFTLGAAYAGLADGSVGSLEPGKWADFILLDRDPFAVPAGDIWKIQVQETWLGGRRVFMRHAPTK